MNNKIKEMIATLDPEIQFLVTEVIRMERNYLDMKTPHGVKPDIRTLLERIVKEKSVKEKSVQSKERA